jgi:hypothetical protein
VDAVEPLDASGRSRVFRCQLENAPQDAVTSVILKQVQGNDDHPYDPENAESHSPAWRFFNDWAGAEFLSSLRTDAPLAARFYGGGRALGFILLEDLGPGDSLAELLKGSDATEARAGMLALAQALGTMHAATAGKVQEYAALRARLGGGEASQARPSTVRQDWLRVREAAAPFGLAASAQEDAELEAVAAELNSPGPFLAFTHSDPCPDNNRWQDGELRLLDFEFGQLRHALVDGVYGRVPFPTCWCLGRLPVDLPGEMERIYRTALLAGVPEASEDVRFHTALTAACAHWTAVTTAWHLERALKENDTWGLATLRQRVVFRLEGFAATTAEFGYLPALGSACAALAQRLRTEWGDEAEMLLYPAFAAQ